jgi:hypothetical protein
MAADAGIPVVASHAGFTASTRSLPSGYTPMRKHGSKLVEKNAFHSDIEGETGSSDIEPMVSRSRADLTTPDE